MVRISVTVAVVVALVAVLFSESNAQVCELAASLKRILYASSAASSSSTYISYASLSSFFPSPLTNTFPTKHQIPVHFTFLYTLLTVSIPTQMLHRHQRRLIRYQLNWSTFIISLYKRAAN